MVIISHYHVRHTQDGNSFVALEIQGDIEFVQSQNTGRFYATARKCSIASTFTEEIAKTLIGKQLPGRIEKVQTEPYEYTIQDTGEKIMLTHSYEYRPEDNNTAIPNAGKSNPVPINQPNQ